MRNRLSREGLRHLSVAMIAPTPDEVREKLRLYVSFTPPAGGCPSEFPCGSGANDEQRAHFMSRANNADEKWMRSCFIGASSEMGRMRRIGTVLCAGAVFVFMIASASALPLRQQSSCVYEYTLENGKLKPSAKRDCRQSLSLVTGDVAVIAAKGANKPASKLSAQCEKTEQETYTCWVVATCTRDKIIKRDSEKTLNASFTLGLFAGATEVGAINPGETKVLVAPKDVSIALGPIDVQSHIREVDKEVETICASGERRKNLKKQYWFDGYHPEVTVTTCRTGLKDTAPACPETK